MNEEINQIIINEFKQRIKVDSLKKQLEEIFRFERSNLDQQSPRFKERYREIIESGD